MNISDAMTLVGRLELLIKRANHFNKTREEIIREILFVKNDLLDYADNLDAQMSAFAEEQHADAIVAQGVR